MNDTLCQISKCWKYASSFERILIVDTPDSGLRGDFSKFFEPRENIRTKMLTASDDIYEFLNQLSCFPAELRGKLHLPNISLYTPSNYVLRSDHSVRLSFDFSKDHEQALLVHEQCGGGHDSFEILENLYISSEIRPLVLDRIRHLNGKYCAVHVRNTDLKTDYKALFSRILPEIHTQKLLVCSDDAAVIAYARSFFSSLEILYSSEIPDTQGKPLHYLGGPKNHAIDAIVDLIALGNSEKLFFSSSTRGYPSGFSNLAAHLSRNKHLIQDLLRFPSPISV
ncbi:hypothetical protein HYPDE_39088 [Hyphomicrobium denitrificans 1NES1]|uniref:Uncharacterized protein n=1 Tax=Hyphomicrobium denitrificans 1NES1 TaxID=670307 RepID=N0BB84_9HYPH|nr:hypothetical protein [Hyphomicrobium denitrificans]AGK59487.1 hypothetical protein HYPDE_39088 [Hyphomicrobium denitrificans 1NES1]